MKVEKAKKIAGFAAAWMARHGGRLGNKKIRFAARMAAAGLKALSGRDVRIGK